MTRDGTTSSGFRDGKGRDSLSRVFSHRKFNKQNAFCIYFIRKGSVQYSKLNQILNNNKLYPLSLSGKGIYKLFLLCFVYFPNFSGRGEIFQSRDIPTVNTVWFSFFLVDRWWKSAFSFHLTATRIFCHIFHRENSILCDI